MDSKPTNPQAEFLSRLNAMKALVSELDESTAGSAITECVLQKPKHLLRKAEECLGRARALEAAAGFSLSIAEDQLQRFRIKN